MFNPAGNLFERINSLIKMDEEKKLIKKRVTLKVY